MEVYIFEKYMYFYHGEIMDWTSSFLAITEMSLADALDARLSRICDPHFPVRKKKRTTRI